MDKRCGYGDSLLTLVESAGMVQCLQDVGGYGDVLRRGGVGRMCRTGEEDLFRDSSGIVCVTKRIPGSVFRKIPYGTANSQSVAGMQKRTFMVSVSLHVCHKSECMAFILRR